MKMRFPEDELKQKQVQPDLVEPEEQEVELMDYIEVVVRWRWLIFWAMVCCVLAAYLHMSQQPEIFRAEATIMPEPERDYLNLEEGNRPVVQYSSYLGLLHGISVNRDVVQKVYGYGLDGENREANLLDYFGAATQLQAIKALVSASEFKSDRGLITIAVETLSPQLSAEVANEYVVQLVRHNREKRKKPLQEQLDYIEKRIDEIQTDLEQAETELAGFLKRNRNISERGGGFLSPEKVSEHSRLQRQVSIRSSLLSTILNQFEIARVQEKREVPDIEVLSYAEPPGFASNKMEIPKLIGISAAGGAFASMLLAFILEYIGRKRESGRMEPIVDELRKDADRMRRLFGRRN